MITRGKEWVWAIVALAIAVALAYTLVNVASGAAESQVTVCVTPEQRDHIRGVMMSAVDHALDEQVRNLFGNWVRDSTGQPKRAQTGLNNTLKAFIVSRANVIAWDPAECTAGYQLQSAETKPWR